MSKKDLGLHVPPDLSRSSIKLHEGWQVVVSPSILDKLILYCVQAGVTFLLVFGTLPPDLIGRVTCCAMPNKLVSQIEDESPVRSHIEGS